MDTFFSHCPDAQLLWKHLTLTFISSWPISLFCPSPPSSSSSSSSRPRYTAHWINCGLKKLPAEIVGGSVDASHSEPQSEDSESLDSLQNPLHPADAASPGGRSRALAAAAAAAENWQFAPSHRAPRVPGVREKSTCPRLHARKFVRRRQDGFIRISIETFVNQTMWKSFNDQFWKATGRFHGPWVPDSLNTYHLYTKYTFIIVSNAFINL